MTCRAFTLIELLVVVTIIVVLLALLAPALDKAIYQAELALCGTRLHGLGLGATNYALQHKRRYPVRPAIDRNGERSFLVTFDGTNLDGKSTEDLRQLVRGYIDINGHLLCPLAPAEVDLVIPPPDSNNFSTYGLWFGFQYRGESEGLRKLGDRLSYQGDRFSVLAGDYDTTRNDTKASFGAHPDRDGGMRPEVFRNEPSPLNPASLFTYALWVSQPYRGDYDTNYVYQDGSVERFNDVAWNAGDPAGPERGERFQWLPEYSTHTASGHPAWQVQLPQRP